MKTCNNCTYWVSKYQMCDYVTSRHCGSHVARDDAEIHHTTGTHGAVFLRTGPQWSCKAWAKYEDHS